MNAEAREWQRPCEWFRELVSFRWLPCGPPRYQFQDKLELVPRAVRLRVRGARASLSGRSPLMLAHVMLAGALVAADSTAELARIVRAAGDVVARPARASPQGRSTASRVDDRRTRDRPRPARGPAGRARRPPRRAPERARMASADGARPVNPEPPIATVKGKSSLAGRNRFARVWHCGQRGRLAQLGEHLVYTQGVGGSSPSPPIPLAREDP